MSYCRWSSDDFKSDLYVYESVYDCWTIHVASNRIVGDVPHVKMPTGPLTPAKLAAYRASSGRQQRFLDSAQHEPITLPHAGETFNLESPGDCADKIAELKAFGYLVPDGVIPTLREEQAELVASREAESSPRQLEDPGPGTNQNQFPQGRSG